MDASTDSPQEPTVSLTPSRRGVPLTLVLGLAVACNAITAVAVAPRLMPRPPAVAPSTPGVSPPRPPSSPITVPSSPSYRPRPVETEANVPTSDRFKRGVVLIAAEGPSVSSAGTGIVLTADGLIMTNYHVVRSTEAITVTIAATGRRHTAELVGRDATKDVALLKLERASNLDVVTVDSDPVRIGDIVVAAGNANGQGYVSAHRGNILELDRQINVKGANVNDPPQRLRGLIETNAPAWPGDSGGPMYDAESEVLGMTTAGSSTGDGETEDKQVYAVPIREALDVVDKIKRGDESGTIVIGPKAYLGVIVQADDSSAVIVSDVQADTPAAEAGLTTGDTISNLDGQEVRTRAELSDVLDTIEPGTTVQITWTTASGRERTAPITPKASPLN